MCSARATCSQDGDKSCLGSAQDHQVDVVVGKAADRRTGAHLSIIIGHLPGLRVRPQTHEDPAVVVRRRRLLRFDVGGRLSPPVDRSRRESSANNCPVDGRARAQDDGSDVVEDQDNDDDDDGSEEEAGQGAGLQLAHGGSSDGQDEEENRGKEVDYGNRNRIRYCVASRDVSIIFVLYE